MRPRRTRCDELTQLKILRKEMDQLVAAIHELDDDEANFMLAEMEGARSFIELTRRQGEQTVLFCVTLWAALLGAVALMITGAGMSSDQLIFAIGLVLLAISAFGHVTLAVLASRVTASAVSRGRYLAVRQYFIDRFPVTHRYVEDRPSSYLADNWRESFRPSFLRLLRLFTCFNALSLGIGAGLVIDWVIRHTRLANVFIPEIAASVLAVVVFTLSIAIQEFLIRYERAKLAERFQAIVASAGIG